MQDPRWYSDVNPNEHTYIPGYGFVPSMPAVRERALLRRYAAGIAVALLAFYVGMNLLPTLLYLLSDALSLYRFRLSGAFSSEWDPQALSELRELICYSLSVGLPFLFYGFSIGIPARSALPSRAFAPLVLPALCISFGVSAVGFGFGGVLDSLLAALGMQNFVGDYAPPTQPLALFLYLLNIVVAPAFFEELAFRGFVLQSLRRFGDAFALLVSSLIFAAAHGNVLQFPNAFLMGLAIGYFVLISGSIWLGMLIHLGNNLGVLLLSLPGYWISDELYACLVYGSYVLCIIVGLGGVLYLARSREGLFTLRPSNSIADEGRKLVLFFTSPGAIISGIVLGLSMLQNLRPL